MVEFVCYPFINVTFSFYLSKAPTLIIISLCYPCRQELFSVCCGFLFLLTMQRYGDYFIRQWIFDNCVRKQPLLLTKINESYP